MELKTVTDPIQLGVCLGVKQHHLEKIRKNNPQGLCVKWSTVYHRIHMCTHRHKTATVRPFLVYCQELHGAGDHMGEDC